MFSENSFLLVLFIICSGIVASIVFSIFDKGCKIWWLSFSICLLISAVIYLGLSEKEKIKQQKYYNQMEKVPYNNGEWLIEDRYMDAFNWVSKLKQWSYDWWDSYNGIDGKTYEFPRTVEGFESRMKLERSGISMTPTRCYLIRGKYWYLTGQQWGDLIKAMSSEKKYKTEDFPRWVFVAKRKQP